MHSGLTDLCVCAHEGRSMIMVSCSVHYLVSGTLHAHRSCRAFESSCTVVIELCRKTYVKAQTCSAHTSVSFRKYKPRGSSGLCQPGQTLLLGRLASKHKIPTLAPVCMTHILNVDGVQTTVEHDCIHSELTPHCLVSSSI